MMRGPQLALRLASVLVAGCGGIVALGAPAGAQAQGTQAAPAEAQMEERAATPAASPEGAGADGPVSVQLRTSHSEVRFVFEDVAGQKLALCEPPCEAKVPVGEYRVALQAEDRDPVPAEESPFLIDRPTELEGTYHSMRGARIAGWIVLVAGTALFGSLLGAGIAALLSDCGFACLTKGAVGTTLGGMGLAAAWITSPILLTRKDSTHVQRR